MGIDTFHQTANVFRDTDLAEIATLLATSRLGLLSSHGRLWYEITMSRHTCAWERSDDVEAHIT